MKIKNFSACFWYNNSVESISTDGLVFEIKTEDSSKEPKLVEISPMWMTKRFPRPKADPENDRMNWSRYRSGKTVPRSRNGFHPVKVVEKAYPHSGRYFFSKIWDILDGKKLGKKVIEKEISLLGTGVNRDRRGFIGKVLLEKRFWKRSASAEDVQSARYSILKDLETFELFETIILMLAWADAEGDPELWNETCEFYYYIVPDLVWADDIRLRFELLDIVAEYAQKQQKVPYRKPLLSKHLWREQTEILQAKLTDRYTALMHSHLLFFHKEELDATRHEWAEFTAKIVISDTNLWDRYSDYSWLAVDVLLRFVSKMQVDGVDLELPCHEKDLEILLRQEIKRYMTDPRTYKLQFEQRLTG